MAEDDIKKDSQPSTSPPQRPATTIDLPAEEVTLSADSETRSDESTPPPAETAPKRQGGFTPMLAAAIGGAIVGAAAICGLWYFGFVLARDVVTDDLNARLAKLEAQPRSTTFAADQNVIADIAARIAKLEAASSTGSSAPPRVTALETNLKGVGDSVSSLSARHSELRTQLDTVQKSLSELRDNVAQQKGQADSSELEKVASRLSPLESAVRNVQQAISARDNNAADRPVRNALIASSLRDSVLRGAPFATELAAYKSSGGDAAAVTALEPFAAQGISAADKLCAELVALLPKIAGDATAPAKPAGFLERIKDHAEKLIRIRPVGDVAGTDSKAIVSRIEAKASRGDVDGILSELAQLPPQQRAPADGWIAKAKARQAALATARDISVKSVGALAPQAQ